MKTRIGGIKGSLTKLEYSYDSITKHQFDAELEAIDKLIEILKDESARFYKDKSFDQYRINEASDDDGDRDRVFTVINSIPFLIKNVDVADMDDDNYLINFCELRTRELMHANAISSHNEFWKQHETIAGNVYGSVPSELLKKENIDILLNNAWNQANVDIIDFKLSGYSRDKILNYVAENFKSYIVVDEVRTNSLLILRYNHV